MKTAKEFLENFKKDEKLKNEFAELKSKSKVKDGSELDKLVVKFAKDKGYDVSEEDVAMAKAKNREVTEEELNNLAAAKMGDKCGCSYTCSYINYNCSSESDCANLAHCYQNIANQEWNCSGNQIRNWGHVTPCSLQVSVA